MDWQYYLIIGILLLFIVFCIFAFKIVKKELSNYFYIRCDRNENTLQDRPLSDFPSLNYKDISFKSCNENLNGRIYYYDSCENKNVIIFCHGHGAGHEAYISEINYFASLNFAVVGFDYRGCKLSEGKTTHFGASIQDLESCFSYLQKIDFLSGKKVYLVGHSWGAYTSLCGSSLPVDKVVAMCPFNSPVKILTYHCSFIEKGFSYILKPFRYIYLKLKYKKYANISSFKTANTFNRKTLIIFGEQDKLVKFKGYNFKDNVKVIILENKGHNPYNTVEGETYLNKVLQDFNSAQNKQEFLKNIDYLLITQQDFSVLNTITNFLNQQ